MTLSRSRLLAFVMVFYGLIMISPLFAHFSISGTALTFALLGAVLVLYGVDECAINRLYLVAGLAVFALLCVPGIYWGDLRYPLSGIFLVFSLLLVQVADSRSIDWFITLATALMLVLLIGAVIGFILVLNGVSPIFDIANTDGRTNYFYYTTFSKIRWGNVIRPSGIYDEPGALSFMVCAIAAIRHLKGRDARITWLMLGMGFVTLSLAHLVYVLIHAMAERLKTRNFIGIAATILPLVLLAVYFGGHEIVEKRLLGRISLTESGEIIGDNRSWRMVNAAKHIDSYPQAMLFGADSSCRFDQDTCIKKFPLMGENPLSPLVLHGIFVSWPYYLALVLLVSAPLFGKQFLVSAGFGALLLQRPYIVGIGYSLITLLVVMVTIEQIATRHKLSRLNRFGNVRSAGEAA
jgi:hypothetical protein